MSAEEENPKPVPKPETDTTQLPPAEDTKKAQQDTNQEDNQGKVAQIKYRSFKRRAYDNSGSNMTWLISFTDVMALMLTFFVLLFSMSHPQKEDWTDFSKTVQKHFNKYYGAPMQRGAQDAININKVNFNQALPLSYIKNLFSDHIKSQDDPKTREILQEIQIIPQPANSEQPRELILSLPDSLLFESGGVVLSEDGSRAMLAIANFLDKLKNRIEIIGHTDPRPTSATGPFPTNWELSLSRAAAVGASLENYAYSRPVILRGQASGRFKDLSDDLSTEQKLAMSRRVDIVLMPDSGESVKTLEFQ